MKVISAQAMATLEAKAYQEGCSESEFMEKAGIGVAKAVELFIHKHPIEKKILFLCGKGNNGGDAFVTATELLKKGFIVIAIQCHPFEQCSHLCQLYGKRFVEMGGQLSDQIDLDWSKWNLIIDGLFGTGFYGKLDEPYASLVVSANQSGLPIISIDIPSGLNGTTGEVQGPVISATETIALGFPKTGFFFNDGWNHVGKINCVDFGLPQHIVESAEADFYLFEKEEISDLLPPIKRNRHKYQTGSVIGLSGSPGMPGAALLSSLATLRGGAGLTRLLHPTGMEAELSSAPYELIRVPYSYQNTDAILNALQKGSATFVGPGIGRSNETKNLIKNILPFLQKPSVIDADALTILSEENIALPKLSILTPHLGEMQRPLHSSQPLQLDSSLLKICRQYAEEKNTTLVLKGAPTFIFHPQMPTVVNSTGDPGMATAGSGDVLTGLLASLLAQGLDCRNAAILGVYLHGLAGECAAQKRGSRGIIASDLIANFADAYRILKLHP